MNRPEQSHFAFAGHLALPADLPGRTGRGRLSLYGAGCLAFVADALAAGEAPAAAPLAGSMTETALPALGVATAALLALAVYYIYRYTRARAHNRVLRLEVRRRLRAEALVRRERDDLERQERLRSEELVRINQALLDELASRERTESAKLRLEQELERFKDAAAHSRRSIHDLNNLLAVIIPSAQLAMEECPPGTASRAHLEQILATSQRARTLLRSSAQAVVRGHKEITTAPAEEFVGVAGPKGNGQHILLVDDEPAVGRALAKYLEMSSYKVTVYTQPKLALDAFLADPKSFDLVITDRTMPELSGTELSRKMVDVRPELPVLLITGYGVDLDPQHVRISGIRKVLAKPVPLQSLLRHINELWQQN